MTSTTILNEGLYAAFHLTPESAQRLYEFAEQHLPNIPLQLADSYHITTVYSRNDIPDYIPATTQVGTAVVPIGYEYFGRDGEDSVIVMRVEHPQLHQSHNSAMEKGGSHDFPNYLPHITLSKKIPGKPLDLKAIPLPTWNIELGDEYTETLREFLES